jgi:glycosyltransferase involved in cell wall biosynthesis
MNGEPGRKVDLTVIIPSYNRLWCLPQAVESCRKISSAHEIIVVDDGSTDGTSEWLRDQPNVVTVRTDNWGKDWAVNTALGVAHGDYVRFLDSDDWLEPSSSDHQLEIARARDSDIVVAGYRAFDERTNTYTTFPWIRCDDFIAQQLGEGDSSHYSAYLFRKAFIQGIPHRQEFGARDDRMFVIEAALRHPKVSVYESPAFVHRHHSRGRLQNEPGMQAIATYLADVRIYQKAVRMLDARGELTPRRRRAASAGLWPVAHWMASSHLDEACELVRWIYELTPDFAIPGHGLLPTAYRTLGFRATERLLHFRRQFLRLVHAR